MSFVQDRRVPFRRPVHGDGWLHRLFDFFRRKEAQARLVDHRVADKDHVNASALLRPGRLSLEIRTLGDVVF